MYLSFAPLGAPVASIYTSDPQQQRTLWADFKTKYAKEYETPQEEERRFGIFLEQLKVSPILPAPGRP